MIMNCRNLYARGRQIAILFALFSSASLAPASASVCALADHIRAANTDTGVGFCPAGDGRDVITIAEDITLDEALPPITSAITIEGSGHTISGDGKFRIFDVDGGNLTIRHLTLTAGKADHGGAVRLQAGALTVYASSFVGNRTEKSAGAIYANGGTIDIRDSRFEDNCAQLATYTLGKGVNSDRRSVDADGCVGIHYTRSEIDGEVQTNVDGGAIRLLNDAQATIEKSYFAGNKATYGGAISTSGRDVTLVINDSSLVGNHASGNGGAIGVVWTGGGTISISGSSFVENAARDSGGAIDAGGESALGVVNSTFSENRSDYEGGALHVSRGAEVIVTHATFIGNSAQSKGDAISNLGGNLLLRNSIIASEGGADDCDGGLNQSVGNLSSDRTCGISPSGELLLDDLTASPEHYPLRALSPLVDVAVAEYCLGSDQLGTPRPQGGGCDIGAIESRTASPAKPASAPAVCSFYDQIIAANTDRPYKACPAGSGHDTIYLIRDFVLTEKLQPITSHITIEGNGYTISGDNRFRIFDVDGGMLTVKNLTMTKGRPANGGGGAVRLQNGGQAVISDSHFISNYNNKSGGAIYIAHASPNPARLAVDGSSFRSNSTDGEGGAIFALSGSVTVRNSSFILNSARWPGSGAIGVKNWITAEIDNSTFIRNRPSAVAAGTGATATLTHVTIQSQDIDPLYIRADSSVTSAGRINLRNSLIDGNGIDPRDCAYLTQNTGNLLEDGSCSPMLSGDPMLADPFSASAYLELQAGSPAIDAADPRYCLATDQIGNARPHGDGCDIGAIEFGASPPIAPAASADTPPPTDCKVTTTHVLNFRDGPNGARIGLVPQGATVKASARMPAWFQVEFQGVEGWISAEYVVAEGSCG